MASTIRPTPNSSISSNIYTNTLSNTYDGITNAGVPVTYDGLDDANQHVHIRYRISKFPTLKFHLHLGPGFLFVNRRVVNQKMKTTDVHSSTTDFHALINLQQLNYRLAKKCMDPRYEGQRDVGIFFDQFNVAGINITPDDHLVNDKNPAIGLCVRGPTTRVPNVWGPHVTPNMKLYFIVKKVPMMQSMDFKCTKNGPINTVVRAPGMQPYVVQVVPYAGFTPPTMEERSYKQPNVVTVDGVQRDAPTVSTGRYICVGTCMTLHDGYVSTGAVIVNDAVGMARDVDVANRAPTIEVSVNISPVITA